MLVEPGLVEQWLMAEHEVVDGATVTDVATGGPLDGAHVARCTRGSAGMRAQA
jgi:hypothetical protein